MQKEKVHFSIMYSPYTIDTYNTFNFDYEIENILYNQEEVNEPSTYDDYNWEYDHAGYVQALAENWLVLMRENIIDDVVLAVDLDGKACSPREYNFTTDDCNVTYTVDVDKLNAYIKANQSDFDQNKIKSDDGFVWLGDETQQKLHYYLLHESIKGYSDEYYMSDVFERVPAYDYISYTLIEK